MIVGVIIAFGKFKALYHGQNFIAERIVFDDFIGVAHRHSDFVGHFAVVRRDGLGLHIHRGVLRKQVIFGKGNQIGAVKRRRIGALRKFAVNGKNVIHSVDFGDIQRGFGTVIAFDKQQNIVFKKAFIIARGHFGKAFCGTVFGIDRV